MKRTVSASTIFSMPVLPAVKSALALLSFFCAAACALAPRPAVAQEVPPGMDETFAVSSIDIGLLSGADAVVRLDAARFTVDGPGEAVLRVRRVVTVMNEDGRDEGRLLVPYDKLRRLERLEARLRDANGAVIHEQKEGDQEDRSAISGFSLYEDNRVRIAKLYHDDYPYTVDFSYEVAYEGVVGWPSWTPRETDRPVEHTELVIEAEAGTPVRHAAYGMSGGLPAEPRVTAQKGWKQYRWAASRLPAYEPEPYAPPGRQHAGIVHTAPAMFAVEGAQGDMRSWTSLGAWYEQLAEGRAKLPPKVTREVKALVAGAAATEEKVRRLYAYMQARTRYVSVQLGLGGWQPFDAQYVHARSYGDCKALVNYMQALLRAAGIEAYPALIRHGTRAPEVLADFPSNQFNHVILAVPLGEAAADGEERFLWLECTSQTIPFGHIGAGNENRWALLVRPGTSRLVRTPRSASETNRQTRRARVELAAEGSATAEVRTTYTGNQQDRVRHALARRSDRERREWLRRTVDLPAFDIARADFSSADEGAPAIDVPVRLTLPRYASPTGARLFVPLNLMERWSHVPPAPEEPRTQPIHYFPYAFADADTVTYVPPAGYAIEAVPNAVRMEMAFARYEAHVEAHADGSFTYVRRLEVAEPVVEAPAYGAFRDFLQRVARADGAQLVLVQE